MSRNKNHRYALNPAFLASENLHKHMERRHQRTLDNYVSNAERESTSRFPRNDVKSMVNNMNNKCKNGTCDYENTLDRTLTYKRKEAEIRYTQLWAEIELPQLLRGENIE